MFVDACKVPDGSVLVADVCVVGAGPAGITIARQLARSSVEVVLLESGGLEVDSATEDLNPGASTGQPYFPLHETRTRAFGGTSAQWAGECRPLDAADLVAHPWVPDDGWPFDFDELAPWYERARPVLELGPAPFESESWAVFGVRALHGEAHPVRTCAFHLSPPTRFGTRYRVEIERSPQVAVHLGATVAALETTANAGQVTAGVVRTEGGTYRVEARRFVLAAGGIENARLLLASDAVEPAGLGNRHDLVGRYFGEHLYLDDAAWVEAPAAVLGDFYLPGEDISGHPVRAIFGLDPAPRRREGLTNLCLVVTPSAEHGVVDPLRGQRQAGGRHPWPAVSSEWAVVRSAGRDAVPQAVGRSGSVLKHVQEQAPNPESRVVLSDERDALGCRRVELRWQLSDLDWHTARRGHELFAEGLARCGVRFHSRLTDGEGGHVEAWPERLRGARHHLGTTRMHPDPGRGVVAADGRVHGVGNLFVAGNSAFPRGRRHPTFTIVALALRLADHLRRLS